MTTFPRATFPRSTVLGYPRIGPRRELKRALESYWDGGISRAELLEIGRSLRADTWRRLAGRGLAGPPSGTFSLYDHVLDTAVRFGATPARYQGEDAYFAMARGTDGVKPLRMTKWFDTNYHYIVPEIGESSAFRLADGALDEIREARALGYETRPVILGPVTLLLLSEASAGAPAAFRPLDRLDDLLAEYQKLLAAYAAEGVAWVQLDEPALAADRSAAELAAVRRAYERLGGAAERPALFVASYFGGLGEALGVLADSPVEAVGVDLVRAPDQDLRPLRGKTVVAGVVSGRDVWRTDVDGALARLRAAEEMAGGDVAVSTSCSLLHVPYDLDMETDLDPALKARLAFADQKVGEVVALARLLEEGAVPTTRPAPERTIVRLEWDRRAPYARRAAAQAAHLRLPPLPTTTTGSFPQTGELRKARAALDQQDDTAHDTAQDTDLQSTGRQDSARLAYERLVEQEIERVIRLQERLGIDVLVHGEPERDDMVRYFAEHLEGFALTRHGWVQSYGSRCTRPPILYGDVKRPAPITVRWITYAQRLTDRPVKGMLTGPVTIVAWSFVRRDIALPEVVRQVADAVREEVADLESAGVSVIQVDEPALRELLPLRADDQPDYLDWAVGAYRHATAGAADPTQIHTHLCYSDAAQIMSAVDALDADVTSIECARSGGRVLSAAGGFERGLGPGVYDIHSPRIPATDEITGLLSEILASLPHDRVWVNPDCGLKTRTYAQVEAALTALVAAAKTARAAI
ncbi:5-methyltetrahydropteroyltriglutamate--homocysteine S-methyltransferase [Streptosporangiaceae bacterium NEAU-GS5]|nr:5-methyltetrahydropteroyltriglutamate--homocysteine S-methyltransferase [Streptosporangiaceae bacterium NEAU-GS5]